MDLNQLLPETIEDRVHQDKPKVYDNIRQYLNDVNWDIEYAYLYSNEQWYILDDMMKVDDEKKKKKKKIKKNKQKKFFFFFLVLGGGGEKRGGG